MRVDIALLAWYDRHARALPWRIPPGSREKPDPYRVWLSEIMLQQTTVAAAAPYFTRFVTRWPGIAALAAADEAEVMAAWAGLGYYSRARNLLACARTVAERHGGRFPADEAALRTLPGVGAYTAAAISAIAFGRHAVVVDANVERVVARLFAVETPLPAARPELRRLTATITPEPRAGDFAQAMMDLGATVCASRSPRCPLCPIAQECLARMGGEPARYPVRPAKKAKPQRRGIAYWLEADGAVLLRRRPPRGMLGAMRALPGGAWTDADPPGAPPTDARWVPLGSVTHVFTHFALTLDVLGARFDRRPDVEGEWWSLDHLAEAGLPTLYARAAVLGATLSDQEIA